MISTARTEIGNSIRRNIDGLIADLNKALPTKDELASQLRALADTPDNGNDALGALSLSAARFEFLARTLAQLPLDQGLIDHALDQWGAPRSKAARLRARFSRR